MASQEELSKENSKEEKEDALSDNTLQNIKKELQENPELQNLSPEQQSELIRAISVTMHKTHSGPLPSPENLAQYNIIIPNGADRIMRMAEQQQVHRHSIEKNSLRGRIWTIRMGQIFGFSIGLITIGLGTLCIMNGHDWSGAALGVGGVTGLVSVFLGGRKSNAAPNTSAIESTTSKDKKNTK